MKKILFVLLLSCFFACDDEPNMRAEFDLIRAANGEATCGAGMIKYEAGMWWECDAYNNWNQIEQPED